MLKSIRPRTNSCGTPLETDPLNDHSHYVVRCANQAQATGAEQKAEAAEWSSGSAASEAGKIIPMSHSNPDGKLSPSPACIQDGIFLLDKPLPRARLRGREHTASQGEMNFASEQLKDKGPALVSA
ncbi:unnamed protein product [Caretta caretta]